MLWLWCKPTAAAPIPRLGISLTWEIPYAAGVALKRQKKKKKKKELPQSSDLKREKVTRRRTLRIPKGNGTKVMDQGESQERDERKAVSQESKPQMRKAGTR